LENIKELVTLATKYDEEENPEEGLESLLADAALATDQDSLIKNQNAVKLMTIHASKGLEFDYVFISGLEENLFPHRRMGGSEDRCRYGRRAPIVLCRSDSGSEKIIFDLCWHANDFRLKANEYSVRIYD
jgi:DNA helicase-2/ATP-dependent DNA helicase PcrA